MPNHDDTRQQDEYDTPWKEILEAYFREFLAFFLPAAHDGIDWQRGYEFLDKELARITREAEIGDRRMDKLAKVWQRDGVERWVLIHVEIQGDPETDFPARMYTYQYRAYDLQRRPVVGLAILADEETRWRPTEHGYELWGTRLLYQFTTIKLLDYLNHPAELEISDNPFAMVTLAHLQAKKTRNQPEERYQAKWQITRSLYQRGFTRQQIIDLFRFVDWVLNLHHEANNRFWQELAHFEESQKMPYITSVERIGQEKGRQIGRQEGRQIGRQEGRQEGEQKEAVKFLLRQLTRRIGNLPTWVHEKVNAADVDTLEQWGDRVLDAHSLEEIFGPNSVH